MSDIKLKRDLADVFNRNCTDDDTNTPDFILAEIAFDAIRSFRLNAKRRDDWRGIPSWTPGQTVTVSYDLSDGPETSEDHTNGQ